MTSGEPTKVSILSAIVCDDVRTEGNGKEILIGVYSGTINVHIIPSPLIPLRCWVNLKTEGSGNISLEFRATDHRENEIFQSKVDIGTDNKVGLGSVSLGPILFALKDPEGQLKIEYREVGGDWVNVITKSTKYQAI